MRIYLSAELSKLLSAAHNAGHRDFINKTELSAIGRNNSLPVSVVHTLTMDPQLQISAWPNVVRLPDQNGVYNSYLQYSPPAKSDQFKKFLKDQTSAEEDEVQPEEVPRIFYSVDISSTDEPETQTQTVKGKQTIIMTNDTRTTAAPKETTITIPTSNPLFVPFGFYNDLETIIKSGVFHPAYITGLSGNGKTFGVTEACAKNKRQFVRVPITVESDEDSLLGGFRLVDGNTVFQLGPIPEAMLAGAVCLLDEVDKASSKIMCLQPVLEGEPIYLKRINRLIVPKKGFNVIATANTKGQGSEKGNFITSLVLDEAFLERFAVTFEQDYPDAKTESKILKMLLHTFDGLEADAFIKLLIEWANSIRKSYADGGQTSVVTTRRLTHIIKNYAIYGQDKHKAVELALNRFDSETKSAFMQLWTAKCPVEDKSFGSTTKTTTATSFANDTSRRPF